MAVKKTKASAAVVVNGERGPISRRALNNAAVVAAIVLVVLIGGGLWALHKHQQNVAYQKLEQQSVDLDNADNYTKKAQVIEDFLANGHPTQKQVVIQSQQLAAAYMRTGDYQKALDNFKKSESDPDFQVASYSGQAGAYAKLGNKQQAIAMHQKIIDLLQQHPSAPGTGTKISMEQDTIKQLESGQ